jgi:hypothetical protein
MGIHLMVQIVAGGEHLYRVFAIIYLDCNLLNADMGMDIE